MVMTQIMTIAVLGMAEFDVTDLANADSGARASTAATSTSSAISVGARPVTRCRARGFGRRLG
jgi:hypothetical protein